MSFISSIGTAVPAYGSSQDSISEFMADAVQMNQEERRRLKALYKASGIEKRYSVLPDFGKKNGEFQFFPNTPGLEPFPAIADRMRIYEREALTLALKAIVKCFAGSSFKPEMITHLITVSCTGMYAPGLDIEIIEYLGLSRNIHRTSIQYMGCYAAFNAIKAGDAICRAFPEAKVLILCVELCTIHYQKNKNWDHILSNAIFGDGAAALLMSDEKPNGISLEPQAFFCDIAPEGKKDMAWHIANFGFEMTLSSYVPSMIRGGIKSLTTRLLLHIDLDFKDIDYFAIHPGGKKILEAIEAELKIPEEKNKHAYDVLKNFGNMSSPTVLFVLHEIIRSMSPGKADEKNILSFAFGPGLTMESMLLRVHETSVRKEKKELQSSLVRDNYV